MVETSEVERLTALLEAAKRREAEAAPTKRKRKPKRKEAKRTFTDADVAALPRKAEAYVYPDPDLPHHCIRVRPKGSKSPNTFTVVCRDPYGKQIWAKVGNTGAMTIEQADAKARDMIERIKAGEDPNPKPPPKPDSVATIAEDWLTRHVEKNRLRSAAAMRRIVVNHILPHWAARPFVDIKRSDIAKLLDHVEDQHGDYMADNVLGVLRSISTWYAKRDDNYTPPFVGKMSRVPSDKRKRERVLDDAEIKSVWRAAEDAGQFGALVRLLLLTGQRRAKIVAMRHDDVNSEGVWSIPKEPREKGNPGKLRLPKTALAIVRSMPRVGRNEYIFPGNKKGPRVFAFTRDRAALNKSSGTTGWRLHDLRRTARSLLSRVGVRPDVAELIIGHAVGGVKEIYDRYPFEEEMADGLRRLETLIKSIITPPPDNVVKLRGAQKGRK
jgi:integrase